MPRVCHQLHASVCPCYSYVTHKWAWSKITVSNLTDVTVMVAGVGLWVCSVMSVVTSDLWPDFTISFFQTTLTAEVTSCLVIFSINCSYFTLMFFLQCDLLRPYARVCHWCDKLTSCDTLVTCYKGILFYNKIFNSYSFSVWMKFLHLLPSFPSWSSCPFLLALFLSPCPFPFPPFLLILRGYL